MPRSGTLDPLDRFRWRIHVSNPAGAGFIRAGFSECSAPGLSITYKEYKEGGRHMNPVLVHDGATFKDITLKRGVVNKPDVNDFSKWIDLAFQAFKGKSGAVQYRRDIVIEHLDRQANTVKRYTLHNCVPTDYTTGSEFSAMDDTGYSIETLTFKYEGFTEETVGESAQATELIKGLF